MEEVNPIKLHRMIVSLMIFSVLFFHNHQVFAFSTTPKVGVGTAHAAVLKQDGTVWSWGAYTFGRLGDPSATAVRLAPQRVPNLSNIVEIFVTPSTTFAIDNKGNLWGWGNNAYGLLGYTAGGFKDKPILILDRVASFYSSGSHSAALRTDGTLWTWGMNDSGQLGIGSTKDNAIPTQVPGISNVKSFSLTNHSTMALLNDGSVFIWGSNTIGQITDGTKTNRLTPFQISSLSNVKMISAIYTAYFAVLENNDVISWGRGGNYGSTSLTDRTIPEFTFNVGEISKITGTEESTIVLKKDGSLFSWGGNSYGQLADNKDVSIFQRTPEEITSISNVSSVAGFYSVFALKTNGDLFGWGRSNNGLLGIAPGSTAPIKMPKDFQFNVYKSAATDVFAGIESAGLNVKIGSFSSFGNINLTGSKQVFKTSFPQINIEDYTGSFQGYRVSVLGSPLEDYDTHERLPAGSLRLSPPSSVTTHGGNPSLSPNPFSSSIVIDDDSAKRIFTAANTTGAGSYTFTFPSEALALSINPHSVKTGNYSTTLTISIISGP